MAATASIPCLLVDCFRYCSAACELSLSSMVCTGSRYRPSSCRANLLAALLMSESLPSLCSGRPTTRASGCQLSITSVMLSQSGFALRQLIVHRAVAVPVILCPTAMPMRCVPKSKPSKVCKTANASFRHVRYRWTTGSDRRRAGLPPPSSVHRWAY